MFRIALCAQTHAHTHYRCWHTNTHTHTRAHAKRVFRNARVLCLVVVVVDARCIEIESLRETHTRDNPPEHCNK